MKVNLRKGLCAITCGALIVLAGCAYRKYGKTQDVPIDSTPKGARITIDGESAGVTPYVATLKRKYDHMVRIEMDGYKPYEVMLRKKLNGWFWGDLFIIGPFVAIEIDNGSVFTLSPSEVNAELARAGTSSVDRGSIYIATVLHADPSWQKIGYLEPVDQE